MAGPIRVVNAKRLAINGHERVIKYRLALTLSAKRNSRLYRKRVSFLMKLDSLKSSVSVLKIEHIHWCKYVPLEKRIVLCCEIGKTCFKENDGEHFVKYHLKGYSIPSI